MTAIGKSIYVTGDDELTIPAQGTTSTGNYTAIVRDIAGKPISDATNTIVWTVTEAEGISIENGVVTVESTAVEQRIKVTATDSVDSTIYGEKEVIIASSAKPTNINISGSKTLVKSEVAPKAFDMEERHSQTNNYAQWQKAKVSAFGSVYRLQKPQGGGGRSSVTPYGGSQLWIMLPNKVIGVVNTNLGDKTTAFGMEGVLQFGEGRGNTAVNTEIQKVSDNTFYYDGLQAIIHDHNYKTVTTEKPKYTETSIYGPVQYIKFNDTDLTSEKTYSKGYNSYYVAEIGVKGSTPAKVDLSQNDGIRRITVDEKGNIWYAFHNTSQKAKDIVAFEDMYCIIEQTTKFVKKGETINIEGYGVLLAKRATDLTGFYYGDSKATALVPNAQITLKNEFDVDGTLIIAVYDNGELSHISFANENQLAYKLPSDISGITVKGFLIDKGNVRPLESAITVKDDK